MAKSKLFLTALVLTLLLSLPGSPSPSPVAASPDEVRWSRVSMPAEGEAGNWVLASGSDVRYLTMAADFPSSRRAYVATSGTESAFSETTDGGISWNQVSLIDTTLSNIVDLAPSPDYAQDNTLFLLTFDSGHIEHSLWRSRNSGAKWERVLTRA